MCILFFYYFEKIIICAKINKMELIGEFLKLKSIQKIYSEDITQKTESYLFYSPDSLTNKNYALALSLCLICTNNHCQTCPDCLKIKEGTHPDVLSFPEGKSLSVLDSKKIVEETTKKPMLSDKKIIIINDIDNSSAEAQNKLLKIIEEPPKNVVFIATATNMDNVLATIKSRMQKRQIEKFSKAQIEQILDNKNSPYKPLAIIKGEGYLGKTLEILEDEKYFEYYNRAKTFVFEIKATAQILQYLTDKNMTRDNLRQILGHMSLFYSDIMLCKIGQIENVENQFEANLYQQVQAEFSTKALVQIQKLLNESVKKIQANGNVGLILETLLVKILEVKYLCK